MFVWLNMVALMAIKSVNFNPSAIAIVFMTPQQKMALVLISKALDGLEGASLDERDAWAILDRAGFIRPHQVITTLKVLGFIKEDT